MLTFKGKRLKNVDSERKYLGAIFKKIKHMIYFLVSKFKITIKQS